MEKRNTKSVVKSVTFNPSQIGWSNKDSLGLFRTGQEILRDHEARKSSNTIVLHWLKERYLPVEDNIKPRDLINNIPLKDEKKEILWPIVKDMRILFGEGKETVFKVNTNLKSKTEEIQCCKEIEGFLYEFIQNCKIFHKEVVLKKEELLDDYRQLSSSSTKTINRKLSITESELEDQTYNIDSSDNFTKIIIEYHKENNIDEEPVADNEHSKPDYTEKSNDEESLHATEPTLNSKGLTENIAKSNNNEEPLSAHETAKDSGGFTDKKEKNDEEPVSDHETTRESITPIETPNDSEKPRCYKEQNDEVSLSDHGTAKKSLTFNETPKESGLKASLLPSLEKTKKTNEVEKTSEDLSPNEEIVGIKENEDSNLTVLDEHSLHSNNSLSNFKKASFLPSLENTEKKNEVEKTSEDLSPNEEIVGIKENEDSNLTVLDEHSLHSNHSLSNFKKASLLPSLENTEKKNEVEKTSEDLSPNEEIVGIKENEDSNLTVLDEHSLHSNHSLSNFKIASLLPSLENTEKKNEVEKTSEDLSPNEEIVGIKENEDSNLTMLDEHSLHSNHSLSNFKIASLLPSLENTEKKNEVEKTSEDLSPNEEIVGIKENEDSNLTVLEEHSLHSNRSSNFKTAQDAPSKRKHDSSGESSTQSTARHKKKQKLAVLDEIGSSDDCSLSSNISCISSSSKSSKEKVKKKSKKVSSSNCIESSDKETSDNPNIDTFSRYLFGVSDRRRKLSNSSNDSQLKRVESPKPKQRKRRASDSTSSGSSYFNPSRSTEPYSNELLEELNLSGPANFNGDDPADLLDFESFDDCSSDYDTEEESDKKKKDKADNPLLKENKKKKRIKKPLDEAGAWRRDRLLTAPLSSDSGDDSTRKKNPIVDEKKMEENRISLEKRMDDVNEIIGIDSSDSSAIEFVCYTKKPRKKARISADDSMEIKLEENEEEGKKGRKNIRTILSEEDLEKSTKLANEEEKRRIDRLKLKKQELSTILSQHDLPITDESVILDATKKYVIKVNQNLSKKLKEHQKQGVKFMWDVCFASLKAIKDGEEGTGCILAHCMGLGKTFQVTTLIHTLFRYKETGIKRVLVICPLSTVSNWNYEIKQAFNLADEDTVKYDIFTISGSQKAMKERLHTIKMWKQSNNGILLVGYESYIAISNYCSDKGEHNLYKALVEIDVGPQIVFCDEGHLLKSGKTNRTQVLSKIKTKRKIILTGTPMQNNLKEYFHMVHFIKPHLLGTYSEFSNRFVSPIMNGQYSDSTAADIKLMKQRSHILHKVLKNTVQRYEVTELQEYLPDKTDFVLFVQLSPVQIPIYQQHITNFLTNYDQTKFLSHQMTLQALCVHPLVLHLKEQEKKRKKPKKEFDTIGPEELILEDTALPIGWWEEGLPADWMENPNYGSKFTIMLSIIDETLRAGDKLLIFSASLMILDAIETILKIVYSDWKHQYYLRMDGTVGPETRQTICNKFNTNNNLKIFLISTRVGGLGLNLVAANRVILMDVAYNPAQDLQSIFRVYRFGQKKKCYIYRLVAKGTMEEVLYERGVTKQAVAGRVVDELQITRHYTSRDIISVYRNNVNYGEIPAHKLPADKVLANVLQTHKTIIHNYLEHEDLLSNLPEEELDKEEIEAAWANYNREKEQPKEKDVLYQKSAFPYGKNLETFLPPEGGTTVLEENGAVYTPMYVTTNEYQIVNVCQNPHGVVNNAIQVQGNPNITENTHGVLGYLNLMPKTSNIQNSQKLVVKNATQGQGNSKLINPSILELVPTSSSIQNNKIQVAPVTQAQVNSNFTNITSGALNAQNLIPKPIKILPGGIKNTTQGQGTNIRKSFSNCQQSTSSNIQNQFRGISNHKQGNFTLKSKSSSALVYYNAMPSTSTSSNIQNQFGRGGINNATQRQENSNLTNKTNSTGTYRKIMAAGSNIQNSQRLIGCGGINQGSRQNITNSSGKNSITSIRAEGIQIPPISIKDRNRVKMIAGTAENITVTKQTVTGTEQPSETPSTANIDSSQDSIEIINIDDD